MIEWRHLRSLVALRETGSLTTAAEQLHLTQSALSYQIKELEDRIGARLFERKSRPLRFTWAGERLLSLADQVLPQVRAAERDLARLRAGRAGRLHLVIECHSCFDWLMPALDAFRALWPEVALDISMGYGFEPLPALTRGQIDMVITADPLPGEGVRYQPLFRYQNVLLLPTDHPLAAKSWIAPADLAGETLITYPVEVERLDLFSRFLIPAGVTVERRTSELTLMIVQLVASGRGLTTLPQWAVTQATASGQLTTRPLGEQGLWSTLHAAIRAEDHEVAYLSEFIEMARSKCFATLEGLRPA